MGEAGSWNVGSADGGRGIGSDVVGGSPAASRVTGRRLGPFFSGMQCRRESGDLTIPLEQLKFRQEK